MEVKERGTKSEETKSSVLNEKRFHTNSITHGSQFQILFVESDKDYRVW